MLHKHSSGTLISSRYVPITGSPLIDLNTLRKTHTGILSPNILTAGIPLPKLATTTTRPNRFTVRQTNYIFWNTIRILPSSKTSNSTLVTPIGAYVFQMATLPFVTHISDKTMRPCQLVSIDDRYSRLHNSAYLAAQLPPNTDWLPSSISKQLRRSGPCCTL